MTINSNYDKVLYLFLVVAVYPLLVAARTETYVLEFNELDFTFSYNVNNELEIVSPKASYLYDDDAPCLPIFSTDIAVMGGSRYVSSSLSFTKRLILQNVKLAQAPIAIPTDSIMSVPPQQATYPQATYPSSNCEYVCASNWSDVAVLHFLSCPFVYDDVEKRLYFINSIELSVNLEDAPQASKAQGSPRGGADMEIVKSLVINKETVDSIASSATLTKVPIAQKNNRIDYVIITADSLKVHFETLARWKMTKGLYSKVITIEEVKNNYTGSDTQVKLKKCLYDLYTNSSLKYALLGGDDMIVPVRGCYIYKNDTVFDYTCPTDMYYSCYGGDFEWNANGNGIYGERDDDIDLTQHINLTRVPVRTAKHANAFVSKQIGYEKDPKWSNSILMCGNRLSESGTSIPSDAVRKGNLLYDGYIAPYWDGTRYKFYDTNTDFLGGADYAFNRVNLINQLSKGYSFVDVISHGSPKTWRLEKNEDNVNDYYSFNDGGAQTNVGYTIITTNACQTNAFDSALGQEPCLSESLIRNPSSGVIVYLGCSRNGFYSILPNELGSSLDYEARYFKNLLSEGSDVIKEKNFGRVVNVAKAEMVGKCSINTYRWVQFGLNPIGDPEMPIFIDTPREFDNVSISSSGSNIVINAGVPGCRVCLMSRNDFGESYYKVFEDVQTVTRADLPTDCNICITKQGYIPRLINLGIIQYTTSSSTVKYNYEYIITGSSVTTSKVQGPVEFNGGSVTLLGSCIQLNPNTTISKECEFKIILK